MPETKLDFESMLACQAIDIADCPPEEAYNVATRNATQVLAWANQQFQEGKLGVGK